MVAIGVGWVSLPIEWTSMQGWWFAMLLLCLLTGFTWISSLIGAYQNRSFEIALGREAMMDKVFNSLPIGIWVRERGGDTVFTNERWLSFGANVPGGAEVDFGEDWQKEVQELMETEAPSIRYRKVELESLQSLRDLVHRKLNCRHAPAPLDLLEGPGEVLGQPGADLVAEGLVFWGIGQVHRAPRR